MAGVCDVPPISTICGGVGGVVGGVTKSAWDGIADSFGDSMASVVKTMLTFWTNVPSPDLAGGGVVQQVNGDLYWLQGFVLVLSFLIVAAKMCVNQSGKPAGEAVKGLCTLVLINGAGIVGVDILAKAGDAFSTWVINTSAHGVGGNLVALTGGAAVLGPLGSGLEFIIALLGILAAIAQLLLLIARIGILTVLTGVLPLAASAIGSEAGKAWLQKVLGWIFAFVFYKPVAALIYATAFTLVGTGKDFVSVCAGLMLVVLAVFALPAIMRLAVPLVGAATSGGGGAIAGAVAGAALATGAKKLSDNRGGSGGGSAPTPTHKPGLANSPGAGPTATGAKATAAAGAGSKLAGFAGPVGAAASGATRGAQMAKGAAESAVGG